jgi:hypothetical protein
MKSVYGYGACSGFGRDRHDVWNRSNSKSVSGTLCSDCEYRKRIADALRPLGYRPFYHNFGNNEWEFITWRKEVGNLEFVFSNRDSKTQLIFSVNVTLPKTFEDEHSEKGPSMTFVEKTRRISKFDPTAILALENYFLARIREQLAAVVP